MFIGSRNETEVSVDQLAEASGAVAMETNQNEAVGAAPPAGHDDLNLGAEGTWEL